MSSRRPSRRLSLQVAERAHWRCEYCRSPASFSTQSFEADHIIPHSRGGPTALENLAFSCGCNSYKGDRTSVHDPKTRRRVSLFHPRRHRWERHFRWDGPVLVGRTPVGRVTIAVLRINDLFRVELRAGLIEEGLFPPAL